MLSFDVHIHGADSGGPLGVSFDAASSTLAELPRMFIEPDGSFVWRDETKAGESWQVDGNLIDRGDVLAYLEIRGSCPQAELELLLGAVGWPKASLVFVLPRKGRLVDE